jgi:SAM-dependent methyltransferase
MGNPLNRDNDEKDQFYWINGRRRLQEHPYLFPADYIEEKRLDIQQMMVQQMTGKLYLAQLVDPIRILDVGTGSGKWALQIAKQFPEAAVLGLDLVRPSEEILEQQRITLGILPFNYRFVQRDILQGIPGKPGLFDYIHMACMGMAIPVYLWPQVIGNIVYLTRPGGWVELVEYDVYEGNGTAFQAIQTYGRSLANLHNLHFGAGSHIVDYLRQTQVEDVQEQIFVIDSEKSPPSLLKLATVDMYSGVSSAMSAAITEGVLSKHDGDTLLERFQRELMETTFHWTWHIVLARRKAF